MAAQPERYKRLQYNNLMITKWLGFLLIVVGVGIGHSLSVVMTWAETEANLRVSSTNSKPLEMSCPWMMSYTETGTIMVQIVNETSLEVESIVSAAFGQPNTSKQELTYQKYILAPKERLSVQWQVDSSNAAFGRIIPVIVKQSSYKINPRRVNACGIVLFNLFNWNGSTTLTFIIGVSILCLAAGLFLTRISPVPQFDAIKNMSQLRTMLCILTLAVIASSLLRWWGASIILEAISAITLGSILTDLLIPSNGLTR